MTDTLTPRRRSWFRIWLGPSPGCFRHSPRISRSRCSSICCGAWTARRRRPLSRGGLRDLALPVVDREPADAGAGAGQADVVLLGKRYLGGEALQALAAGVENVSQVQIEFDPTEESLVLHAILCAYFYRTQILPPEYTLENYRRLGTESQLWRPITNSVSMALIATAANLVVCFLAAIVANLVVFDSRLSADVLRALSTRLDMLHTGCFYHPI